MLVEVGVISLVLASAPPRCGTGESVFLATSSGDTFVVLADGHSEPSLLYSETLESALAKDLALVSSVRHVLVERADDNLLVWIAVENPTREIRERVFQKELALIEGFQEISFDFNIVPATDAPASELASGAKLIYSREG
jgi:hypothetical protein